MVPELVFSCPPRRFRQVGVGIGEITSQISSPMPRLEACPNQHNSLWRSIDGNARRLQRWRRVEHRTRSLTHVRSPTVTVAALIVVLVGPPLINSRQTSRLLTMHGGPGHSQYVSMTYGLRRWNREWPVICTEMAQDRRACSAIVRDGVNALEAGQFRPR